LPGLAFFPMLAINTAANTSMAMFAAMQNSRRPFMAAPFRMRNRFNIASEEQRQAGSEDPDSTRVSPRNKQAIHDRDKEKSSGANAIKKPHAVPPCSWERSPKIAVPTRTPR